MIVRHPANCDVRVSIATNAKTCRSQNGLLHHDTELTQVTAQHAIHKQFFLLSFNVDEQVHSGRPPKTFLRQASPSV